MTATKRFTAEAADYREMRQAFWSQVSGNTRSWSGYYRSRLCTIYQNIIPTGSRVLEIGCGRGDLLAAVKPALGVGVDFSTEVVETARKAHPQLQFFVSDAHAIGLDPQTFDYVILSDIVNDLWDVQSMLADVRRYCGASTRLVINFQSYLWSGPLRLAQWLGIATPTLPQNWLTPHDMENLLEISGLQPLRTWHEVLVPLRIPWIADFANRYLAKIWPFYFLDLAGLIVARPLGDLQSNEPSVTVVVAARNESGHIEELMARIPNMGSGTEIVFVEGNSTDDTYEVIERAIARHPERQCKLLKQPGKGKGDAVRTGFAAATGDILMILDADITVPPEDLPRFYALMACGQAEFVNGVRLVYPMADEAMRFANLLANKAFSRIFSWLLGQPIRDTLCGTKVLWRSDYERLARNRSYFGDFDPFGDFDLLFGAARLNLKIMEVPIRYRARRYGETNISRWRHGLLLLRMVMFAARRLKFV